jgi:hypothetical protein
MQEVSRGIQETVAPKRPVYPDVEKATRYMEQHKARLAAMSPQEREAREKRLEEQQRKWDYGTTPEGQKEFARFLVTSMKLQGKLPPTIDHLWLNLPSGWAEYREVPAKEADKAASYTVTLDKTPTQEEWDAYATDLQAKMNAWHAEKVRKEAASHAGDPRYDPMTGDLLLPDELPLSPTSEYLLTGKTRPRRFIPPGSPYLHNGYKPLGQQEGDPPESEYTQRRIKRLLKAGFVEVEPVGRDWQYFAFCERLRNISPNEVVRDWQEYQREARERLGLTDKTLREAFADLAFELFDLVMRLLLGLPTAEEEERNGKQPPHSSPETVTS